MTHTAVVRLPRPSGSIAIRRISKQTNKRKVKDRKKKNENFFSITIKSNNNKLTMSESGWNRIDSDAGLFTELVEKLGVENIEINDLFSIDSDSLKQVQPIYGVIFLFKYNKLYREYLNKNQPITGTYDPEYLDNGIFFANQTIQDACATQAVLNVLFNLDDVKLGDELNNFRSFVTGFDSMMIGETISNSDLIRSVHNSFLTPHPFVDEDKQPPSNNDDKDDGLFHFAG